jgi:hypothetical protein
MKSTFPCTIKWLQKIHVEKQGNSGILKAAEDLWEGRCTSGASYGIVLAADDAVLCLPVMAMHDNLFFSIIHEKGVKGWLKEV